MPTTTVNATYQGLVQYSSSFYFDWSFDIRGAVNGNLATTYTTNTTANAIRAYEVFSRGGTTGVCCRTFLFFDVSSIVGDGIITDATLSVLGGSTFQQLNTITVKGDAWGTDGSTTTLANANYSDLDFNIPYSDPLYGWDLNAYNNYALYGDAINDMQTFGYLNIVVIDYDYDYLDSNPGLGFSQENDVEFLDSTSPIKLTISYVPRFGVIGISPLLTNKVIGVDINNISRILS